MVATQLLGGCRREAAVESEAAPQAGASPSPSPSPEIVALHGFRGEAHAVIALPDGDCIVALSWFGQTDFGAGPMRNDSGGRQSYLVRYSPHGQVRGSTQSRPWVEDLAFDGRRTVLAVGNEMHGVSHALIDVETGAVVRSGLTEGYAKAAAFVDGKPLVLSKSRASAEAVLDDVSAEPVRWAWRAKVGIPLAMAPSIGGGAIITVTDADDTGQMTAIAIARDGKELWRRPLCPTVYSAPIAVSADGSITIVACEPAKVVRLGPDGAVRREVELGGSLRAERIAELGGRLVIAGQLLGELTVGDKVWASWDRVDGGEQSGSGDAVVVVHDGREIVAVTHGHGLDADQVTSVAVTGQDVWMVGDARYSLDFGGGKLVAPDPGGAGVGFVGLLHTE